MNVNLDADINNIIFLEHMDGKDNGELFSLLVDGRRTQNTFSNSDFEISRISAPHLSKDC